MRDALFACLSALQPEARRRGVEVIVVESSADGTAEAIASAFPFVRVLAERERRNAAAARNLGVAAARAELVCFVDADCTVEPGYVDAILHAHASGAAAVGGPVLLAGDEDPFAFILHCTEFSAQLPRAAQRRVRFSPSCNLSIRKSELLAVGGFPDEHERSHDLVFCTRWIASGRPPFLIEPRARVVHHGPRGARASARHLFVLGRASGRVRRLEPMKGSALASPLLLPVAPLLVPYRLAAITARLARADHGLRLAVRYAALAPVAALALSTWTAGFVVGALAARHA